MNLIGKTDHATSPGQLSAAELHVGELVAERRLHLNAAVFEAFARLTGDAHPIHYDTGYAITKGLKAPIAHGLLLTAMTALGATTLSGRLHDSMIAMLSVQAEFVSPVFVDDEVIIHFRVATVEPKSHNRSVVSFAIEMASADSTVCARIRQQYLMKTTPFGETLCDHP